MAAGNPMALAAKSAKPAAGIAGAMPSAA